MKSAPCHECPHRKPTCHDFCREYLEWHDEQLAFKKAKAFDRMLDSITEFIIWRETRVVKK